MWHSTPPSGTDLENQCHTVPLPKQHAGIHQYTRPCSMPGLWSKAQLSTAMPMATVMSVLILMAGPQGIRLATVMRVLILGGAASGSAASAMPWHAFCARILPHCM